MQKQTRQEMLIRQEIDQQAAQYCLELICQELKLEKNE